MRIKYDVSKTTLIEGYRLHSGRSQAITAGAVIAVVVAAKTLGDFPAPRTAAQLAISVSWLLFVALIFFAGFALLYWFLLIPIRASAAYRQNPLSFAEMELVEDEDGVELNSPRSTSRYRWSDFRGFKENDRIFLLCLSKSFAYPIPKLGLSPETIQQIRQRWDQKLKRLR
jgi:YcxB-like protein